LLAGAYAYPTSGTFEDKLEAIITQKWVALAGTTQGIEAFFERNRTGIPKTSPVTSTAAGYVPGQFVYPIEGVTGAGNFARRLLTPENEITRNPNAQAALKPVTTKVWWAKQTL
ncbi:MAG TPA: SusD/RagB family nutrient-binding outer membrane lipoprotein, partial [Adhaeribacter sp.]|nr:SusD/RagB family nutrient-binding outer membrane lipoprotein [Adhaeribacter sp.]